jgi:hypothetical protein
MINIVIDPVLVMTPPDDADSAEVEAWLGNLTTWLTEALTAPFTWLHYREASQLLEANGQFPGFEQLRYLQRKHRLDINVAQIARHVNEFFRDDTLDLERHLKRQEFDVELEAGSVIVKPEQFIERLPPYIHESLYVLLANCCACKHINFPLGRELHITTLALADGSKEIAISVVILEALPDFARAADNRIAQTFPLLITPDDLLPLTKIIDLWAKGEQGIFYAIKQQCKRNQAVSPSLFKFRLGPRFIDTVNERGLDTNEIVLRSIIRAASDVIADKAKEIPGYRLHAFRKDKTADSPQLIRDSDHARAWRLMLQRHGAGWRLHYWQIPAAFGSIIEFSNVCKESEREIY